MYGVFRQIWAFFNVGKIRFSTKSKNSDKNSTLKKFNFAQILFRSNLPQNPNWIHSSKLGIIEPSNFSEFGQICQEMIVTLHGKQREKFNNYFWESSEKPYHFLYRNSENLFMANVEEKFNFLKILYLDFLETFSWNFIFLFLNYWIKEILMVQADPQFSQ